MRAPSVNLAATFPGLTPTLLAKYTIVRISAPNSDRESALTEPSQLDSYIRTTNPAPNGSKDLSEVRKGDVICLEGSPCKISSISSTGRLTFVEGTSLIDNSPYVARFNHCYGITVSTFEGNPELLQCSVVSFLHRPAAYAYFDRKLRKSQRTHLVRDQRMHRRHYYGTGSHLS